MQLSRLLTLTILLGGGLLVGWVWLGGSAPRNATPGTASAALLQPGNASLVARGADIYARACANCHGANLEGQAGWRGDRKLAPPHDESGHTWHHPDKLLFEMVKEGTIRMGGSMPGFKGMLTDEDIIAVLSYIKSRWPARVREAHDAINARAGNG